MRKYKLSLICATCLVTLTPVSWGSGQGGDMPPDMGFFGGIGQRIGNLIWGNNQNPPQNQQLQNPQVQIQPIQVPQVQIPQGQNLTQNQSQQNLPQQESEEFEFVGGTPNQFQQNQSQSQQIQAIEEQDGGDINVIRRNRGGSIEIEIRPEGHSEQFSEQLMQQTERQTLQQGFKIVKCYDQDGESFFEEVRDYENQENLPQPSLKSSEEEQILPQSVVQPPLGEAKEEEQDHTLQLKQGENSEQTPQQQTTQPSSEEQKKEGDEVSTWQQNDSRWRKDYEEFQRARDELQQLISFSQIPYPQIPYPQITCPPVFFPQQTSDEPEKDQELTLEQKVKLARQKAQEGRQKTSKHSRAGGSSTQKAWKP